MQVTWPLAMRRIVGALEIHASIAWTRGPLITIKARALKGGIITALMKRLRSASRPSDRDPRGANQGVLKHISSGSSGPSISDPTDAIYPKRSTMDRSIVMMMTPVKDSLTVLEVIMSC